MLVTAVITEISYRYVELPIRERRLKESIQALLRSGPGELRRRISFGVIISCSIAFPVFAASSLVTADYKANDVQASLDVGQDSVTDVIGALTSSTTSATTPSSAPESTNSPTTTTTYVPPHYDVFALGDSVMKGAAPALADLGIVVDAVQDRQGKMGADIFVQLKVLGVTMDATVVHLGTNGPMSQETLDTMMQALSDVPRVVVLTIKANRGWTDSNNEKIRALPATYSNVMVLDWQLLATLCSGDCLTADGIHLEREGSDYYVQEIWKALGR
jgi:hypothetical protein